jgi:Apea-like HEPN
MTPNWLTTLFDQELLICDEQDQGATIRAICVLLGVQVDEEFVIGPITIRPRDEVKDKFPEDTRTDFQQSVLELKYIDRKDALSMYMEPTIALEAAVKTIQLLVNTWSGISLIYHLEENNLQMVGRSGSFRFETADSELPQEKAILEVTDANKELFKQIFKATFGNLGHAINRFSRACTEIKDERVLDFVIALESTLGYKLSTEIAHRLASRGAFLLGFDPSKRQEYYSIFKTLYKIRSRIAHGDTVTAKVSESFVRAITSLQYWTGNWSAEYDVFKIRHIADVARQVTRQVLIEFIKTPQLLNEETLLRLELGILED